MDNGSGMANKVNIMKNIKSETSVAPLSPPEDNNDVKDEEDCYKETRNVSLSGIDPNILCAICSGKISKLAGKEDIEKLKDDVKNTKTSISSCAEIAIQTEDYTWLQVSKNKLISVLYPSLLKVKDTRRIHLGRSYIFKVCTQ